MKNMKPLIKWPGGKSREFKHINDLIPENIETYIEPFFGGGGIFFKLEPKKSFINDINENLMVFYQLLKTKDEKFKKILTQIANDWDNLDTIAKMVFTNIKKYKSNISTSEIKEKIDELSISKALPKLINGQDHFWKFLSTNIISKLQRIIDLEIKNGIFTEQDFLDQIIAATKGAYYYYLRDIFIPKTKEEEIAQFFFLREYCFGSMFRFNNDGKFNIPYGGASYNEKSFHQKINNAFSSKVNFLFNNVEIYCDDFRLFFQKIDSIIKKNDFCFFDPPYDTEFSEYDKQSFNKKDHEDLAILFGKLRCKALMIIKKTDFIDSIYNKQKKYNSNITISEYEKNYTYNVRGRNQRDVIHLLILNYQPNYILEKHQLSIPEIQLENNIMQSISA